MAKIPTFKDEQEESEFWDTHSFTDYLDETEPVDIEFVDARPHKVQISLRLAPSTITRVKAAARQQGIGYQTLIRMWVLEKLAAQARTEVGSDQRPAP